MKRYKTSTIILSIVVLIQSGILTSDYIKNKSSELPAEYIAYITSERMDKLDWSKAGKKISVDVAKKDLARFKSNRPLFYSIKKRAYGYTFGLDIMHDFLADLKTFNITAPKDSVIAGVRIYRSKSLRDIDGDKKDDKFDDVILVPVLENGNNYYPKLDPDQKRKVNNANSSVENARKNLNDPGILNTSWPCPNKCSN